MYSFVVIHSTIIGEHLLGDSKVNCDLYFAKNEEMVENGKINMRQENVVAIPPTNFEDDSTGVKIYLKNCYLEGWDLTYDVSPNLLFNDDENEIMNWNLTLTPNLLTPVFSYLLKWMTRVVIMAGMVMLLIVGVDRSRRREEDLEEEVKMEEECEKEMEMKEVRGGGEEVVVPFEIPSDDEGWRELFNEVYSSPPRGGDNE